MEKKATIRLLIIIDTAIDYENQIISALNMQRQDYLKGADKDIDIVWQFKRQDLSNLNWIEYGYGKNNYGVNTAWIIEDTKNRPDVYSIAYVINNSNWTRKGNLIHGWSVGFYNGHHVQLIRGYKNNVEAMYRTFLMELIHSFNEYAKARLGVNFNALFDVYNWDEDVIHAEHPDYKLFEYISVIEKMKPILIELFKIKQVETMYNVHLVFDPHTEKGSKDRKIYRLNFETMERAHLNNPEYFNFTYGKGAWADVEEISKEEFTFYKEVGPAGFEQDFKSNWLQQIVNLIKRI